MPLGRVVLSQKPHRFQDLRHKPFHEKRFSRKLKSRGTLSRTSFPRNVARPQAAGRHSTTTIPNYPEIAEFRIGITCGYAGSSFNSPTGLLRRRSEKLHQSHVLLPTEAKAEMTTGSTIAFGSNDGTRDHGSLCSAHLRGNADRSYSLKQDMSASVKHLLSSLPRELGKPESSMRDSCRLELHNHSCLWRLAWIIPGHLTKRSSVKITTRRSKIAVFRR